MISLAFIAALSLAQQGAGVDNGGMSRGNFLRKPDYATPGTGAQTYYVDPTGNDANNCTSTGTSACLTIQGAINKIPKLLRDQVTVSIAAGTYAGAIVTGFRIDNGVQQSTGGLLIDGALTTSTLATGSATGTAAGAGQSAGSGATFGTLCDSGATWTASDLIGRFITTASPTNSTRVITANTTTCVTIAGTWTLPVAGSTTYTIQDPSVIVSTPITGPATPINSAQSNRAAFIFAGNDFTYSFNAFVLRNVRISNTTGFGIIAAGGGGYHIEEVQLRTTSTSNQPLLMGGSSGVTSGGAVSPHTEVTFTNVDLSINASNLIGVSLSWGSFGSTQSLFRNAQSGNTAIDGSGAGTSSALLAFTQNRIVGWNNGIAAVPMSAAGTGTQSFQQNQISCGAATGVAIALVNAGLLGASMNPSPTNLFGPISTTNVDTCGTGILAIGSVLVDVISMSGSVASIGFDARYGGTVLFTSGGVTMTSGGTEINLDSSSLTAAYADVTAPSCVATAAQGSRVCTR